MIDKPRRAKAPPKRPGRPRTVKPTGRAATFLADLERAGKTVEDFAEGCEIYPSTVYRWIRDNTVPKWASWLAALLPDKKGTD